MLRILLLTALFCVKLQEHSYPQITSCLKHRFKSVLKAHYFFNGICNCDKSFISPGWALGKTVRPAGPPIPPPPLMKKCWLLHQGGTKAPLLPLNKFCEGKTSQKMDRYSNRYPPLMQNSALLHRGSKSYRFLTTGGRGHFQNLKTTHSLRKNQ